MDGSQFDRVTRALGPMFTRRTAVAMIAGALAVSVPDEIAGKHRRKRKKKCAKSCQDGCCTSKFGKCIKPAQQSSTQCGTGGGACQNTECPACTSDRPCPVGQCCGGSGTCGECKVFVTSTPRLAGALGGLAGADATCQARAAAADLPGSYMAWLSNTSASPSSRFTKATVPYALPDGETVATNWADLTSGNALNHAINQTETGDEISGTSLGAFMVWTHTMPNGTAGGSDPNGHCESWTSASPVPTGNTGDARSTTVWTQNGFQQCATEARLYCFQQR